MKSISVFNPGDNVRLIDGTRAVVITKAERKNHYVVDSVIHGGHVVVFAGDMELQKEIHEEGEQDGE